MMRWFESLRARLGDFWWWSLMLFVALRCGDAINAFIGLWLVPKYVPQSDLGAIMPMMQFATFLGAPITVLVTTFMKFLNEYKTKGEDGKVKSLVRAFWGFAILAIIIGTGISLIIMPQFFKRARIAEGSLGLLIIATAILSTSAPVFTNALQALKKFKAITVMNLCTSPVRLIVMLVAMPFRALSGYMLGQAAPYIFQIIWSCLMMRKEMASDVQCESIRRDLGRMANFAVKVLMGTLVTAGCTTLWMIMVRDRLSAVDSAAYYFISRFAEIATYAGLSLVVIMFPLAAEAKVSGKNSLNVLIRTIVVTVGFGLISALVLFLFGERILILLPLWHEYIVYVPDMAILAVTLSLGVACVNYAMYELALGRFFYLWHNIPLYGCFTSFALLLKNPSLRTLILLMLAMNAAMLIGFVVETAIHVQGERGKYAKTNF